ncbi:secretion system protein [Halosimplex rubrum]|uniref:Secretion system protein n=1 Tax=Halosimplex rubrum TaxID=869889 RepID=A0A7D5P1H8_9EURY|nr:secretion system protein [Halosimplex rubrum]QLH75824.1 secretion system protein [Halosimplex rubrum]
MGWKVGAVRGLARIYPYEVETSDDLVEAVAFVESPVTPETVVRAGFGAGVVAALLVALVLLAVGKLPYLVLSLPVGVAVIHGVHTAPTVLAGFRRTEALGDTPNLIGRAVLRMQIQPATETAVEFAARTGRGPLAASLESHIDRSIGSPQTGLISFAEDWAEEFPALQRAAHLLATAENAPPEERERTLERSLRAILDGTREEMAQFTSEIRGPTTGLYAFGVMLPLALVALVPAIGLAGGADGGFSLPIEFFVLIYDVALPAGLVAASVWLLQRRPVAFPPPRVTTAHPDVDDQRLVGIGGGLAVGLAAAGVTALLGFGFLAPIAGLGLGLGTALLAIFGPIKAVRDHVRDIEEDLTDALYLVGRQVSEGQAVESAIAHAGERVPGETGAVFERAAGLQERLHVTVDEAFFGEYGSLSDVPSPRAHGMASLLSIAAREGRPAGSAVVAMADHLEELQEVEAEARRELSSVTGTLDSTAAYFGPLVAGATVALAKRISDSEGTRAASDQVGQALSADQLGLVVGVYVLLMSVILTTLSIGLRNGLDRSLVGYHVGRSLVSATPIYVLAVMGTVFVVNL